MKDYQDRCPLCSSEDIEYDAKIEMQNTDITKYCRCNKCKNTFEIWSKLKWVIGE